MMKTIAGGLAAALLLTASASAHAAPPAAIAPNTVSGWGWNVMDLEAQRAWYEAKLGMVVINTYKRPNGQVFEYIMGFKNAPPGSAIIALLASAQRKPGPTGATGRVILRVPDSKALAEWLAKEGVPSRMVAPGAYFFADPEGNSLEIYTPPAS